MIKEKKTFLSYIIPTYDEITLFAMGFTCSLLLIAGTSKIEWEGSGLSLTGNDIRVLAFIALFLVGVVLSIYHAFTDRPKTAFEKTLMLLFAVLLNALSGIVAGDLFPGKCRGLVCYFPHYEHRKRRVSPYASESQCHHC